MSQAKITLTLGDISFSGEGDEAWLTEQLDKLLKAAATSPVRRHHPSPRADNGAPAAASHEEQNGNFTTTLAAHIKAKNGESNQVQRFLATADWLHRRGQELTTAGVSAALRNHHQKKLANPAECLNKNVANGFCEKTDSGFFITPDGLNKLGSSSE